MNARALLALWLCAACLGSCRANEQTETGAEAGADVAVDGSNPLESAARDAGLIDDPNSVAPTGLYENRHVSGVDSLCVRPGEGGAYRFGMIASFGVSLRCEGRGSMEHDGAALHFTFEGADCAFDGQYDGRSVKLAGQVPAGCSALCGPRASLSGVSFDRSGWSEADALQLRSRGGAERSVPLCQ